jgi:hypothetical protein
LRVRRATRFIAASLLACAVFLAGRSNAAEDALFASKRVTPPGEYTAGIEGPAVDAAGNLYVVNFQQSGTIGQLAAGASRWTRRQNCVRDAEGWPLHRGIPG